MLEFRQAAAKNNVATLKKIMQHNESVDLDEAGPTSGRTAAHQACIRGNFEVIYWLYAQGADFYCKDKEGKTAIDYLQEYEFKRASNSKQMLKASRDYFLCNAHYKIWLAHEPSIFMPYLYRQDFIEYRKNNPNGFISLVYSLALLNEKALSELKEFAQTHKITLISFEDDLNRLTTQFGTTEDKECYQLASEELKNYPDQAGGNLAVVADLIRWSSVLLRIGSYSDTDVNIGQHQWSDSIKISQALQLNLGTLIHPEGIEGWMNIDIIAAPSLFAKPHEKETFKITLPRDTCTIIKSVQQALIASCHPQKMEQRREKQQLMTIILSDISKYLIDYFNCSSAEKDIIKIFTEEEINTVKNSGLDSFSDKMKSSIIERMANLKRATVEQEFETPDEAHQYSRVFENVGPDEHKKFLMNYMQAILMTNIKENVKHLSGSPVVNIPMASFLLPSAFKLYSIYHSKLVASAFRSQNTVRFGTPIADNRRKSQIEKMAHLSFTSFGMRDVMEQSERLLSTAHQSTTPG